MEHNFPLNSGQQEVENSNTKDDRVFDNNLVGSANDINVIRSIEGSLYVDPSETVDLDGENSNDNVTSPQPFSDKSHNQNPSSSPTIMGTSLNSQPECDNDTTSANNNAANGFIHPTEPPLSSGQGDTGSASESETVININVEHEEEEIAPELFKVFLSLLFTIFGFLVTTFSLALTHERMPDYPPLPDIVMDNIPYQEWGLDASEYILIFLFLCAIAVIFFHKHRFVILRRVFLMLGLLYLYRGICFYVTVLPKADPNYYCSPKLNHTITFVQLMKRVVRIVSGGGLSINGQQVYCGDFIYSGHTMAIFFSFFIIREYTPRKFWYLHGAALALGILGIIFLLIGRGHYTIDVIIAYFITSQTWWLYHSMAHNDLLHKRGEHNYFTNNWWYIGFYYFEAGVPKRPLPREYNLPLPQVVQDKIVELVSRSSTTTRPGYQQIV